MLVLTRKANQSFMIGDDIEISVLAITGEKVRIGIDAPRSVSVHRKEVWVDMQEDREEEEEEAAEGEDIGDALDRLKSAE